MSTQFSGDIGKPLDSGYLQVANPMWDKRSAAVNLTPSGKVAADRMAFLVARNCSEDGGVLLDNFSLLATSLKDHSI